MSSPKRASKSPSRTSSPFSMHPNGYTQADSAYSTPPNAEWHEPPSRQPAPSFQDHVGLARHGVVNTMLPLGTLPTARVKARAKGDPLRKVVQARHLGGNGMVVDEGRGTPEAMSVSEGTRAGSLRAEALSGRASPAIDPALMDFDIPEVLYNPSTPNGLAQTPPFAQMAQQQQAQQGPGAHTQLLGRPPAQMEEPTQAPPEARHRQQVPAQPPQMQIFQTTPAPSVTQPSPSLLATPSTNATGAYTPSPIPSNSPFFSAVKIANRNQTPEVHQPLAFLYSATQRDEELVRLLQDAARDPEMEDPVNNRDCELAQKIKRVKRNFRAQTVARAPMASVGADGGRQASNASVSPSKPNQTILDSSIKETQGHPNLSSNPQRASPLRTSTRISQSSGSHQMGSRSGGSASVTYMGNPSALSRKASTSSLSSVDERLASAPPPPPTSDARQSSLKRSLAETGSVLTPQDDEMDTKRKRLKRDFSSIEISESGIRRPPIGPSDQLSDLSRPAPHLKFWPLGVRNGSLEAETEGPATPTALGRPPTKKKETPRTKTSPIKNARKPAVAGVARLERRRRGSNGHDDNKSEASDNNDYCSACGGPGYLLCCDGCDRSFHFNCLDPPLDQNDPFDSKWFCSECQAGRDTVKRPRHGLFADLHLLVDQNNPKSFSLPHYIKTYFQGQRTGSDGEFVLDLDKKAVTAGRQGGTDDEPDFKKLQDAKGNAILCYACDQSSVGFRDIVSCDYCPFSWHLDCLDPPLANPPYRGAIDGKRPAWMCPLHSEHDLKTINPLAKNAHEPLSGFKTHRYRRISKPVILRTHMRRGFVNNGLIEVETESDNDSGFESEESPEGVLYKLPRRGIKLDFIDKVKQRRLGVEQETRQRGLELRLHNEQLTQDMTRKLSHDISRRRHEERKAAFNLTQFRDGNTDLKLGDNELENLIYTLEAEATPAVSAALVEDEAKMNGTNKTHPTRCMPSPPASSSMPDSRVPTPRQREILLRMNKQIAQMLDAGVNGA